MRILTQTALYIIIKKKMYDDMNAATTLGMGTTDMSKLMVRGVGK